MDDSPDTVANTGVVMHVKNEYMWHALDHEGKQNAKGIVKQKEDMFEMVLSRKDDATKLFYLGVFFHYQQDTWAHRHHYSGFPHSKDYYTTYDTPFGHALDSHQPDRPPFDPCAALMCIEESLHYAKDFLQFGLHRYPRAFFDFYMPIGVHATTDEGWWRKGKYFQQLSPYGDFGSPQKVISEIIRRQVSSYGSSIEPIVSPFFLAAKRPMKPTMKIREIG